MKDFAGRTTHVTGPSEAAHGAPSDAFARFESPATSPPASGWRPYASALALVGVAALAAELLERGLSLTDPALIFLTAVLFSAVRFGLGPSILGAVASVLVYDFFWIEPLYTFTIARTQDVVSLVVFLVVAVLTSNLTARVREQTEAARRREEHTAALRAQLEEKGKTAAVIEAIEDGLVVLDPAGVVVHANEVACAILELPRAQTIGRRFDDLATYHPHYLRVRAAVREFLADPEREGERVEITLFVRGRDHYFVLRPTPLRAADGTRAGLILGLQDVTYLRDHEARREALIATLSHELRTPITSLSMALELLDHGVDDRDPDLQQLIETAREDVARLQDLAQRLLDLSRTRAMTIALERRPVDIRELVQRVTKIFAIQAREKGVALETVIPDRGLTITGDETKLTWAVSNLLSNALRYTPARGAVRIEVAGQDGDLQIAVSDTGPGIAPDLRERIFERFTQVADGGEMGSAGLGLAIVRDIVQAHGGRIHLESAVGRGSRFVLEIPRG